MNIAFDAKRAYCNSRGLGNYSRDLIRIMVNCRPENRYSLFSPVVNENFGMGVYGEKCAVIRPHSLLGKQFKSLWRTAGCAAAIAQRDIDVYHGLSNELPVGVKGHTAQVLSMHDIIFLTHPELYPRVDRFLYKKKYIGSCERADRIVAISQETKNDLVEYVGIKEDKIDVIYQGCNPVFHQPFTAEHDKKIADKYGLPGHFMLIVCALEERKNHKLIMQAMTKTRTDLPLVIVGRETAYKQELKKTIAELHLEQRVIFCHHVETKELPSFYRLASLFIFPSLSEGFGIPILEAMTCSTPVIASKCACFYEVGADVPVYVNYDAEEMADSIDRILEDEELSAAMSSKGKERSILFSDENIASNLMACYQKAVSSK